MDEFDKWMTTLFAAALIPLGLAMAFALLAAGVYLLAAAR